MVASCSFLTQVGNTDYLFFRHGCNGRIQAAQKLLCLFDICITLDLDVVCHDGACNKYIASNNTTSGTNTIGPSIQSWQ